MSSLYIHIPFCKNKCLYCDFPSYHGKKQLMNEYIEELCREIKFRAKKEIGTIFIGGGTPTYLDVSDIEKLGDTIKNLNLSKELEFTVEGNPGTFTKEKLIAFKNMGVNRLSIGLQAYQNYLLGNIGRIHTVEDFISSYHLAREIGFNNINVDLMFGLPGQSMEMWLETLNKIINLNPEHISAYSLIIEEGTPFYEMYLKEELSLPGEELEREMYEAAKKILKENSYYQYEISNFSKKGKECMHNLVYWNLEEYIGCGSAAHSFIDDKRISNVETIEDYIKRMKFESNAVKDIHINSENETIEEYMFMGLRKIDGISLRKFRERFNRDVYEMYKEVIEKFIGNGLLIRDEDYLKLSSKGIELSNVVMQEFLF